MSSNRFQEPSESLNDPSQPKAFRSFWTAPGGPSRPPEGMYEYNPNYQQQQQAGSGDHGHAHGPDDGDHSHSHGPHGHGHGHQPEQKEDTPLLASSSSSSSSDDRSDRRIFGLFSSYVSLCYCLIPLLLALLVLGLLFGYSSSLPAPPPLIVTGASPTASSIAAFCNPFALFPTSVDLQRHHGLVALLYLLPSSLSSSASSSSYYLQHSVSGNSTFFFSALDTPTRLFTRVFQARNLSSGEQVLLPSQYFLLSFHTVLMPPSRSSDSAPFDPALPVQLALISDDGASLFGSEVPETESSPSSSSLLIDNDGVHTTRIASSSPSLNLSSPLNLTLRYFQGPPAHIALQLLYRQQGQAAGDDDDDDDYDDEEEEDEGADEEQLQTFPAGKGEQEGNDLYWFAGSEGAMSTPTRRYQQLTDAGWRVVPADWYWLPARYEGKEEIDRKLAAGIDPCL